MKLNSNILRKLTATLLTIAMVTNTMVMQGSLLSAGESTAGRIVDVELHEKGILTTRVVNMQGQPIAGETLTVHYQGKQIAASKSDENGFVVIGGLRPGVHTLSTPVAATACRLWSPTTAPPAAVGVPAVVSDPEIIRGQFGAVNLPMILYAGATAAALFVAFEAESSADDANDANAALRARVEALEAASP